MLYIYQCTSFSYFQKFALDCTKAYLNQEKTTCSLPIPFLDPRWDHPPLSKIPWPILLRVALFHPRSPTIQRTPLIFNLNRKDRICGDWPWSVANTEVLYAFVLTKMSARPLSRPTWIEGTTDVLIDLDLSVKPWCIGLAKMEWRHKKYVKFCLHDKSCNTTICTPWNICGKKTLLFVDKRVLELLFIFVNIPKEWNKIRSSFQ